MARNNRRAANTPASSDTPSNNKLYQSPSLKSKHDEGTGDIWTRLENAILKQSEFITSSLTLKISESEERLSKKIDDDIAALKNSIKGWIERVEIIETKINGIDTIKRENDQLKQQLNQHCENINNILTRLDQTEEKYQQKEISSDALLQGVPCLPNENLKSMFNHMCVQIAGFQPPSLKSIFRLRKQNNNYPHAPIVIKFLTPADKSTVLRSIANYRMTSHQPLRLRDLGFDDNSNDCVVFIHECLTAKNRSLLQSAIKLKRDHKLFSVFTMRGLVHIKKNKNEKAILITNAEDLAALAADLTTTNEADYED